MGCAPAYAGVELGGTKSIASLMIGDEVIEAETVPTQTPDITLATLDGILEGWDNRHGLAGLGIASFGPIALDRGSDKFGHMLATPKAGWSGADVFGALTSRRKCPAVIDTDVNAAALAEYRLGAAQGCSNVCYVTIGTGVGGGLLVEGVPLHGALHPELGHVRLRRSEGDEFAGTCPFHGDCIEGLVSGPALAERIDAPIEQVADEHPVWKAVATDIGQLVATVLLAISADRVVLGGSVPLRRRFLMPLIHAEAVKSLAGYLPHVGQEEVATIVVLAGLGELAGPFGALELAKDARWRETGMVAPEAIDGRLVEGDR